MLGTALVSRQGPLEFTAQQKRVTRNKKTNKGTRPLQAVARVMKRRGKNQLVTIRDNFRYAGQGDLRGSDIWAAIWMAGRSQPLANLRALPSQQRTGWDKDSPEEIRQARSSGARGRRRTTNLRNPASFPCEFAACKASALHPSNLNPYLVHVLKVGERELRENTVTFFCTVHTQKSLKIFVSFWSCFRTKIRLIMFDCVEIFFLSLSLISPYAKFPLAGVFLSHSKYL